MRPMQGACGQDMSGDYSGRTIIRRVSSEEAEKICVVMESGSSTYPSCIDVEAETDLRMFFREAEKGT